jgi:RNA polymerase sigma-70 factor (ECF subfamily)
MVDQDSTWKGRPVRFATTRWNLVQAHQDPKALNALLEIYWKPLYFYVRQHGNDPESAKDIVQEFLTTVVEKKVLAKADPARGRFRTFLLAAISNYMKDRRRAEARQKRGAGRTRLSIDYALSDADRAHKPRKADSPEEALNRAWARSLWEQSLAEVKADPSHLAAFKLYIAGNDYRAIAARTGLTESAASKAVHRIKRRLAENIRAHLRQTVSTREELEAELEHFKRLLS